MAEDRRSFVKKVGLASFMLSPSVSFLAKALGISEADAKNLISFQFHLFRPKDLLDFEYSFIGATPDKNTFSKIKYLQPNGRTDSYMIVRIAQQHISELFIYLDQNNYDADFISKVKYAIAKSFIAGYSFLVFKIDFEKIGYKLKFNSENLLWWNTDYYELITGKEVSTPVVNPNYPHVFKDGFPFIKNGNVPFTTFELPYKLYLTPFPDKFIFDSNKLKQKGNTIELWSNQIQSPLRKTNHPSFKVIGYENNGSDYTGSEKYLPTETDRQSLTTQFLRTDEEHEAETLDFRISSLGAITKIRYNEKSDSNGRYPIGDIIEWKQDVNLGRDNYVKIVTLGVIMPFGHKCKHIRIGERKIIDGVSFVEYKEFIEPLEFEKSCFLSENIANPNEPGIPPKITDKGDILKKEQLRNTPFKTIRIITKISPPIIPVDDLTNEIVVDKIVDNRYTADPIPNALGRRGAFWAKVKNDVAAGASPIEELLHFNYVGVDWNDNEIHFKAPFIFARDILFTTGIVDGAGKGLADVKAEYDKAENKIRREIDIAGQKIAYYKTKFLRDIGTEIDSKLSELETQTIQFLAFQGQKFLNEFPYYPQLEAAYVYLPVVKEIIKDPRGTIIKYADVYRDKGIEKIKNEFGNAVNNVEGILLDVRKERIDPVTQKFTSYINGQVDNVFNNVADKLAGVVKPEMVIQAISLYENAYGTYQQCAEVVDIARNIKKITATELQRFKDDIFKEAKLLGAIELKRILSDNLHLDNLPISEFKEVYDTINGLRAIEKIQVRYNWIGGSDIFEDKDFGIVHFYNHNFSPSDKTNIAVNFFQEINLRNPSKSFYESKTSLNNFGVGIQIGTPIIILYFNNITFKSATNQKPDVDVAISKVEFSGLLELVKQLQESLGTFGKGLTFDISFDKILVGYQFEVPAISAGAFNLSNIKLGFDFNLYFKDKPIDFWFRFSERESPFLLSVGIFGGRGYFGIRVSSKRIEEVEALLEFGGYLGIDVGIARGCVFLFAGIFYRNKGVTTDLYGYLVCGGVLNVLGIIELSMTFYMGLESHGNEGALVGTASVTVKIRLGFFKIERTASMTKRITGKDGASATYLTRGYTASKVKSLMQTAEDDDSIVYDECDRPIRVPDDSMLYDSLDIKDLIEEYSNAYN